MPPADHDIDRGIKVPLSPRMQGPRLKGQATRHKNPISPEMTARNAAVLAMRAGGESLAAIGEKFGLTRERVRQIILRHEAAPEEDSDAAAP